MRTLSIMSAGTSICRSNRKNYVHAHSGLAQRPCLERESCKISPFNETIVCLLLRRDVLNALPISISLLSKSTTMTWKFVSPVNKLASVSWLIKWCTQPPCSLTGRMKYTVALLFQLISFRKTQTVTSPFLIHVFWQSKWLIGVV